VSRSLAHGELGFQDRLAADATIQSLVGTESGGGLRLYPEWIGERVIQEDDTYRAISFFRVGSFGTRRLDTGELRIQSDAWVAQAFGGTMATARARLEAIDSRMLELLDEVWWAYDGIRLNAYALPEQDPIGGHIRPFRRTREWLVGVN